MEHVSQTDSSSCGVLVAKFAVNHIKNYSCHFPVDQRSILRYRGEMWSALINTADRDNKKLCRKCGEEDAPKRIGAMDKWVSHFNPFVIF